MSPPLRPFVTNEDLPVFVTNEDIPVFVTNEDLPIQALPLQQESLVQPPEVPFSPPVAPPASTAVAITPPEPPPAPTVAPPRPTPRFVAPLPRPQLEFTERRKIVGHIKGEPQFKGTEKVVTAESVLAVTNDLMRRHFTGEILDFDFMEKEMGWPKGVALNIFRTAKRIGPWGIPFMLEMAEALVIDPAGAAIDFVKYPLEWANRLQILADPLASPLDKQRVLREWAGDPLGPIFAFTIIRVGGKRLSSAVKKKFPNIAGKGPEIAPLSPELPQPAQRGAVRQEPVRAAEPVAPAEPIRGTPIPPERQGLRPVEVVRPGEPQLKGTVEFPEGATFKQDVIGLSKAEVARIREDVGIAKLPPGEQQTWLAASVEAVKRGLDKNAVDTAAEVVKTKRVVTDAEHAGMVLKVAELNKDFNATAAEASRLIETGNPVAAESARARLDGLLDNISLITEASDFAGSSAGRALNIRKLLVNQETFDLASVSQRAQINKQAKLTTADNSKLEGLVKINKTLEEKLAKAEENNLTLIKNQEAANAEAVRRKIPKRSRTVDDILSEQVKIKDQLASLGLRVNDITGLTAEGTHLIGKLAVNYIKLGAQTLKEVVTRVQEDIPDMTTQDVHQALISKNPKQKAKARSEIAQRVVDLKTQARLLLDIEKAEAGVFDPVAKRKPKTGDIKTLQKKLKDLRAQAYRTGLAPARLEQVVKTINDLQGQLSGHFRTIRAKEPINTAELRFLNTKISDLRRQMRTEDNLAIAVEQLRTGEFIFQEKAEPRPVSPSLERAQIELKRARRNIRNAIEDMAPLTKGDIGREVINTLRTIKATADMSAVMRQGMVLSSTRPALLKNISGKGVKAFFREFTADQIDNSIRSAPHHWIRERSGLKLTEAGGTRGLREELFGAKYIERVPVLGGIVKASNRHMTSHLNLLRVGVFDEFLAKFPNATRAELAAYADWINIATGIGDLGRFAAVADILSLAVFAPKFAVSRVQTPFVMFKYMELPRVRAQIAKDFAGFLSVGMTTLALADMAGASVSRDPRDSDFGKIRIGDTRIDIWGGVQQPVRVMIRGILAATDRAGVTGKDLLESDKAVDPVDLIATFAGYKLGPGVTIPREIITAKTAVGQPTTIPETLGKAATILWIDDVLDAVKSDNALPWQIVGGLTFFGVGANTFEDSKSKTVKKIRRMRQEFNNTGAALLKNEWNLKHPDDPIIRVVSHQELKIRELQKQ